MAARWSVPATCDVEELCDPVLEGEAGAFEAEVPGAGDPEPDDTGSQSSSTLHVAGTFHLAVILLSSILVMHLRRGA